MGPYQRLGGDFGDFSHLLHSRGHSNVQGHGENYFSMLLKILESPDDFEETGDNSENSFGRKSRK